MTAARPLQDPSMTDLMEELKMEFRLAQQRNEPNDAVRIQHMITQMLNDIRNGVTNEMVESYNRRIADLFFQIQRQPEVRTDCKAVSTTTKDFGQCSHVAWQSWKQG